MRTNANTSRLAIHAIFALITLVIIGDFVFPGKRITGVISEVLKERQQYYNAAQNYHYSYKVITSEHTFLIEESFGQLELVDQQIEYSVSRIFKEVNWYKLLSSKSKSVYSLRWFSGLILPLLALISIIAMLRFNKKIGNLVFVLEILVVADLIFLVF